MDCLFCRIADKKIPASIVFEDEELVAFHDINPQAPVHILIIPRKHIPTINDLEETDIGLVGKIIMKARDLAKDLGFSENGYRILFNCNRDGGQQVYHIHLHLLGKRQFRWPPG